MHLDRCLFILSELFFYDDLTSRMSSQDERHQMTATVGYLESGQDRFVYNTTPISYHLTFYNQESQ